MLDKPNNIVYKRFMDRILDPKKWHDFLRRVHKYIKESENNQISRTKLSQRLNNHSLLDAGLLKLVEDGYINREERVAPGSKTGKVSVWYVWLKDLPFNLGVENLTPTESELKAVRKPLKDRIIDLNALTKEEIKKKATEWIENRPDFVALITQQLLEGITQQEIIDMSASQKLQKACELIEKEMMLRGKVVGGNNFTLMIIDNASKEMFDKRNEVNVEPTNYKEEGK